MLAACNGFQFPRDAENTLDTVLSEGEMTVAVSENPPWVAVESEEEPAGVEADLVRAFAEELGVSIEWVHLDAASALRGLEEGDINLAIGGFDRSTVTPIVGAAPSYAYFEEAIVIGARLNIDGPYDLENQTVFVPRDLPMTEAVRREGANPVTQWTDDVDFAVAPHWLLLANGLRPTETELRRAAHVMAVRQGENAWLMRLERFLRREADSIGAQLREALS
ncbi:substrate-binding periplasmic protein [Gymnodinialimonas ceratoperidinii]|uniref:Transporter substrate-binding domain-containing protein n=1 Tax=Gymnodinialimonas ceratoperidinii TaxID=2856823 RepID=A0A8F6YAT7_9RHOB|nr:transporter substrate-binding domain-containing protein [Gymnodinialimonas ceratoperidinii]QXT39863.1 transporter substrate-binding domain-containing protein [Gymnodinialimonas ceratoperidinii]